MWGHQERIYYNFSEIISRYAISKTGLDNCILNGTLAVHVWIPPISVFKLAETVIDNRVLISRTESHWEGYTAIHVADYRKILHKGSTHIREFPAHDPFESIALKQGADDIEVNYDDLVILAKGKEQLEEYLGMTANSECTVEVIGKAMGPQAPKASSCDPAFRHIKYKGREHQLGSVQAAVVKRLYDAAKNGDPWQSGKRILQEVGSETFALKDVFTRQPFWRDLIVSDSRGMYRLHEDFIAGVVITV
jgi:hypothetical protein